VTTAPDVPPELRPTFLLSAYAEGLFPMDDGADSSGPIAWYAADPRAVLPLHGLRLSRNLRRSLRRHAYAERSDTAFETVMRRCARPRFDGDGVWISERFVHAYCALHRLGAARSFEVYAGDHLVGGVYGVCLERAFFAESTFHDAPDAGTLALVSMARRLRDEGYLLCDIQQLSPQLARLGAIEVPLDEYRALLARAMKRRI
jgi:leucyl/phenylalanyl-tRNA--protein transferase